MEGAACGLKSDKRELREMLGDVVQNFVRDCEHWADGVRFGHGVDGLWGIRGGEIGGVDEVTLELSR